MSREQNQKKHEQLVDFLNTFEQYKGCLKKVKNEITSDKVQFIDTNDINMGVVVLTDALNLSGGSISDIDLYELLQVYFQAPEFRNKINKVVRDGLSRNYLKADVISQR